MLVGGVARIVEFSLLHFAIEIASRLLKKVAYRLQIKLKSGFKPESNRKKESRRQNG